MLTGCQDIYLNTLNQAILCSGIGKFLKNLFSITGDVKNLFNITGDENIRLSTNS